MVFSSLVFIYMFLPCVLAVYFLCPSKMRNAVLLIASLIFYGWGEPVYILIMLFSTVFDYMNGLWIEKYKAQKKEKAARAVLILSVVGNLAILFFFKYINFVLDNVNALFGAQIPLLKLVLPIGISFYTFQTMSYSIDVYLGVVKAQKNIVDFGCYVTMFPQLVAGPIVRYQDIAKQMRNRKISIDGFAEGVRRFVSGLFKKVVLANNMGLLWEQIASVPSENLAAATAWLGAGAFMLQIYLDFSGYSDMAIGLGKMFGFDFPENFKHPYRAKSITEFWRRWHISLGTWFREYVYIPLGGNRKGRGRMVFNLLVVWCLTGFWHGASWNFLLWGFYFAVLLIAEKLFLLKYLARIPKWLQHMYTLVLVLVSWVIFAMENIGEGMNYLGVMFGINASVPADGQTWYYLTSYFGFIALAVLVSIGIGEGKKGLTFDLNEELPEPDRCEEWIRLASGEETVVPGRIKTVKFLRTAALMVLFAVSIIFLVGDGYNPFLYFRF